MRLLFGVLILAFMGPSLAQTEENKPSIYDQGMAIIKTEGVDAGITFFEEHAIQTGSYRSLFGMAWGYWVDGNFAAAEKICNFILRKEPRPIIEAHCNYLQGHIAIVRDEPKKAHLNFILALTVYQKLNRHGDVFETYSGLAAAEILAKEYDAAQEYLQ